MEEKFAPSAAPGRAETERAVADLREVKEPGTSARGLWVSPKPGFGLDANVVGFWWCPLLLHVPATPPFLPPRRTAAGPRRSLFNSASHKFIMLIYHAGP